MNAKMSTHCQQLCYCKINCHLLFNNISIFNFKHDTKVKLESFLFNILKLITDFAAFVYIFQCFLFKFIKTILIENLFKYLMIKLKIS